MEILKIKNLNFEIFKMKILTKILVVRKMEEILRNFNSEIIHTKHKLKYT